ncbi:Hypothetical predicted protein, partial [Paramuricea clavata]
REKRDALETCVSVMDELCSTYIKSNQTEVPVYYEYNEAKDILKYKFGGQRRQLQAYLDQLENMPTLKNNDIQSFEKFADLVRVTSPDGLVNNIRYVCGGNHGVWSCKVVWLKDCKSLHARGEPKEGLVDLLIGVDNADLLYSRADDGVALEPQRKSEELTIDEQVKRFWEVESYDNKNNALSRLDSTERKLKRDEIVSREYQHTIESYMEKGYLRKVGKDEVIPPEVWYLLHFPIIRMDKTTTKVRIVFDCSVKTDGLSLNDVINSGPKLQKELFDVLLRFRRHPVALACDIKEMYL